MWGLAVGLTNGLDKPVAVAWEVALAFLCTAPWMLLYFSGAEDLALAANRSRLVWVGLFPALLLLYYCDRYTSLSMITKAAIPLLAVGLGTLPLFVRRLRFLFVVSSVAAGGIGILLACLLISRLWSTPDPSSDVYADKPSEAVVLLTLGFCLTLITGAVLSLGSTRHKKEAA
jgi:hypothetical protein